MGVLNRSDEGARPLRRKQTIQAARRIGIWGYRKQFFPNKNFNH